MAQPAGKFLVDRKEHAVAVYQEGSVAGGVKQRTDQMAIMQKHTGCAGLFLAHSAAFQAAGSLKKSSEFAI